MPRNNEKTWRILRIIIPIAGFLIAIGVVYATINHNSSRIEVNEVEIKANSKAVISMQKDIEYIKEDTEEIKGYQQEILKELRE